MSKPTTQPPARTAQHRLPTHLNDPAFDGWVLKPDKLAKAITGLFGDELLKVFKEKRDAAHPEQAPAAVATGPEPAGGADPQEGSGAVPALAVPERAVRKLPKTHGRPAGGKVHAIGRHAVLADGDQG